jgi:Protein of unknown function (DUF3006)
MKATIDRIEGTIAVLIPQDDDTMRFNLPLSLLPPGSREGDILTIGIERDPAGTAEAKKRVSGRIDTLKNRK